VPDGLQTVCNEVILWQKILISYFKPTSLAVAKPGLKMTAVVDANTYVKGIKKTDEEMASLNLTRNTFHG